jgi:putative transposase
MSSYRQLVYHIVFRTKKSIPSIDAQYADQLYKYIGGIIRNKESHLYRINGIEDHIHILTDLHPSIALADFIREIKVASSKWMKESRLFPNFAGWSEGYGAFTCSYRDVDVIIEYIKNQQTHHIRTCFDSEYRKLLLEAGLKIDERYFP